VFSSRDVLAKGIDFENDFSGKSCKNDYLYWEKKIILMCGIFCNLHASKYIDFFSRAARLPFRGRSDAARP
jgi:hypothetical protein